MMRNRAHRSVPASSRRPLVLACWRVGGWGDKQNKQATRGGRPGDQDASPVVVAAAALLLSLDTVCVLPTAKEEELLNKGQALLSELQHAVEALCVDKKIYEDYYALCCLGLLGRWWWW
jgi:hypothetical protein